MRPWLTSRTTSPACPTIVTARTVASSIHLSALPNAPPPTRVNSTIFDPPADDCSTADNSASYDASSTSGANGSHAVGEPLPYATGSAEQNAWDTRRPRHPRADV